MNGIDTAPWPATLADAAKHHAPTILRVVATQAVLWATLHAVFWLLPAPRPPNQVDASGDNVAIYFPKDVVAMRSWWSMRITTRRLNKLFTVPQVLQPAARVFYLVGAAAVVVLMAALAWSWTTRSIAWFIEWRNDPGLVVVGGDAFVNTDVIEQPVVQIPGVNMPLASLRPYLIGAVIAVLVHEAGHGMAAAAWNLGVHAVTLDVHLAVPVAAVHVRTPLHPSLLTDLALATAGIWHNLVLALLATTLATHPLTWLSFGYTAAPTSDPSGLLIVDPGPIPLPRYDRLVSVNGIRTHSVRDVADLARIPPLRQCRVPTATVLPCCRAPDLHGETCFVHGNGTACATLPPEFAPSCAADSDCLVGACMAARESGLARRSARV
ncbi:Regulator of sigma-E protease RseP [Allomyces javanicus]|nr:Regulator of sigma-E protease RseP [Allomyces javanicus]